MSFIILIVVSCATRSFLRFLSHPCDQVVQVNFDSIQDRTDNLNPRGRVKTKGHSKVGRKSKAIAAQLITSFS